MVRQKVNVNFLIMVYRPVRCGQYSEGGEQGEQCHQAKEDGEFIYLFFSVSFNWFFTPVNFEDEDVGVMVWTR